MKEKDKNIPIAEIILLPEIKTHRIQLKAESRSYKFRIVVDTPISIKFQDLIKGIFDGLYIKPNIFDIKFYPVYTKQKVPEEESTLESLGWSNKSYLIYLDHKKYIEDSLLIKSELFYFNHVEDHFTQIPVYLEQNEDDIFIDSTKECKNKVVTYDYYNDEIDYLPIIIIKKFEYINSIKFLSTYYKYYKFRNIPVLIDKLILPAKEDYKINHHPNNEYSNFFIETTDTNNYKIYSKEKIKEIIDMIKYQSKADKMVFQKNNFKLDIEMWVRTVFNILAEYIQFCLQMKPIYYVCKKCLYPIILLDKRNLQNLLEKIIIKVDKLKEDIGLINSLVNLITPSYFKNENLPEINVLYYNEEEGNNVEKDCKSFMNSISGLFLRVKNIKELKIILKEIYSEYLKDNKSKFQLILSFNSYEIITNYIINNNYLCIFDNICIYSNIRLDDSERENIKFIYQSKKKNIHFYENGETVSDLFLKYICLQNSTNCYNHTKIINYEQYKDSYYSFHEKISEFYGNISNATFNNNIGIVQDFINCLDDKKLRISVGYGEDKKKALIETLLIFKSVSSQRIENFKDVISVYTKENYSFYQDFNYWLRNYDKIAIDKISFFISDFMYCLNKYGEIKKTGINDTTILYRGTKMNYIDLLLYERNIGKIITFPSFLSTSCDKNIAYKFGDFDNNIKERKKKGLFSVLFEIKYEINNKNCDYYPLCFDISQLSKYKYEKEVLFQPFSFFELKSYKINIDDYTAYIELNSIKKLDILEQYIKDKYKLEYNKKYNIVEIPEKTKYDKLNNEEKNSKKIIKKNNIINTCEIKVPFILKLIKDKNDNEYENKYNYELYEYKEFLDYKSDITFEKLLGEKFINNNKNKIKIYVNNKQYKLSAHYIYSKDNKNPAKKNLYSSPSDRIKFEIEIELIIKFEFKNVTDMSYMFCNSSSILAINDISNWDTSNVINMQSLFEGCTKLNNLPNELNWNTSNVVNICNMFKDCKSLETIPDISHWDASNFEKIDYLFCGCSNLKTIPKLFAIKNPNIKSLVSIFENCSNLEMIDNLQKWYLNGVTNIKNLFNNCSSLKSIPEIQKWGIKNIDEMAFLFNNCSSLKSLPDISGWNISNIKSMNSIFKNCKSLISLPDISKWDISNVEKMSSLFEGCESLIQLPDISKWNTSNTIYMDSIFCDCIALKKLPDISKWKTNKVINISKLFMNCSSLDELPDISNWKTNKVINISKLFMNCSSLNKLPDISKWNIGEAHNISSLFENCNRLKTIPNIFIWDIKNVKNMSSLFANCNSLLSLSEFECKWDTSNVVDMSRMFSNCSSLQSMINFSKWDVSSVENMDGMFSDCKSIKHFPNMIKWEVKKLKTANSMFENCSSLEWFPNIGHWKGTDHKFEKNHMFFGCKIIRLDIPTFFGTNI